MHAAWRRMRFGLWPGDIRRNLCHKLVAEMLVLLSLTGTSDRTICAKVMHAVKKSDRSFFCRAPMACRAQGTDNARQAGQKLLLVLTTCEEVRRGSRSAHCRTCGLVGTLYSHLPFHNPRAAAAEAHGWHVERGHKTEDKHFADEQRSTCTHTPPLPQGSA